MTKKILAGKKVAVLLETEYIPFEIDYYQKRFTELGAQVDLMSYLWGDSSRCFMCDIDSAEKMVKDIHTIEVDIDVTNVDVNDYHVVLMAANYCSVRLREIPPMYSLGSPEQVGTAPAVKFFHDAMINKKIIKGALCHALWILTPHPELLKGRKVICHTVVLADVINAGGVFVPSEEHVVIDDDLVTGRSAADLVPYVDAVVQRAINLK